VDIADQKNQRVLLQRSAGSFVFALGFPGMQIARSAGHLFFWPSACFDKMSLTFSRFCPMARILLPLSSVFSGHQLVLAKCH